MGLHHPDRAAGLDEHGLVLRQRRRSTHHGVVRPPVPGCAAGAAVHDKIIGPFGVLGIEVVHQHPQRSLGGPGACGQCGCHVAPTSRAPSISASPLLIMREPVTDSTAATAAPLATSSTAMSISWCEPAIRAGCWCPGGAQCGDDRGAGGRVAAASAARSRARPSAARWPAPESAIDAAAQLALPTSPSTRGLPAWPSWESSRPRPVPRAA